MDMLKRILTYAILICISTTLSYARTNSSLVAIVCDSVTLEKAGSQIEAYAGAVRAGGQRPGLEQEAVSGLVVDPVIIDRVIELIAETLEQKSDSSLSETLTVLIEFTKNSTAISSLTSLWTLKEALMELSNDRFKDQIELILTQLNAVL